MHSFTTVLTDQTSDKAKRKLAGLLSLSVPSTVNLLKKPQNIKAVAFFK